MSLRAGGLHHVSIRTTDLGRAKRFYTETMGFQQVLETDGAVLLNAHGILFGLWGPAPETSPEDVHRFLRPGRHCLGVVRHASPVMMGPRGQRTRFTIRRGLSTMPTCQARKDIHS